MIFRRLIPVLKWFRLKIMNNHTLIIGNLLGMAWEIENYQVGFLKNICFISSILFHNFLLLMVQDLLRSFFHEKFCFYLLKTRLETRGNAQYFCALKKLIQFNSFIYIQDKFKCCQKLEELKVENVRVKNICFWGHTLTNFNSNSWNGKSTVRTFCTMNFRSVREFFNTNLDGLIHTKFRRNNTNWNSCYLLHSMYVCIIKIMAS